MDQFDFTSLDCEKDGCVFSGSENVLKRGHSKPKLCCIVSLSDIWEYIIVVENTRMGFSSR
jgi:hypothetical protein